MGELSIRPVMNETIYSHLTLVWACKGHVTQGGSERSSKNRGAALAFRIPEVYAWKEYTRAYRKVNPSSAVRRLPCDSRRGDGLNTRTPTLHLLRITDVGPRWCAPHDPVSAVGRRS